MMLPNGSQNNGRPDNVVESNEARQDKGRCMRYLLGNKQVLGVNRP